MRILVGYVPAPEGIAAFDFATGHAQLVGAHLTVLNTGKDGDVSVVCVPPKPKAG